MKRDVFYLTLALIVLAVPCGCNEEQARKPAQLDFSRAVNSIDLSQFMASLQAYPPGHEKCLMPFVDSLPPATGALSQAETRLIGISFLPDGAGCSLNTCIWAALEYAATHEGQLPPNGAALYEELATPVTVDVAVQSRPDLVLRQYANGINPATGKFFTTFQAGPDATLAVNVSRVNDPVILKNQFGRYQSQGGGAPEVWDVLVYGETPGRVIGRKYILRNYERLEANGEVERGS